MKRSSLLVVLLMCCIFAQVALAQDASPTPAPPPVTVQAPADVMAEVLEAEGRIAAAEERANTAFDNAATFLGIFEAIGLIVTVISGLIAALAVVGGLVGFRGLRQAQEDLETAKKKFEDDLEARTKELQLVREAMESTVETQRQAAANANLALSFLQLGERQYRSQDYLGALDTYQQALKLDPNSLITHYRLGYVFTQSGKLEEAQYHLNQALAIEPNFAPALAGLGYVFRRIGEKMAMGVDRDQLLNRAEQHLLRALSISFKLVDDDNESWWGSLGGLYRRRGQTDQAIAAYERAKEVAPKSSYAWGNLARLYAEKQNFDKMYKTYQRVEQLARGETLAEVDNYWAYADLMTAQLVLGKSKDAEITLNSVLEIAPTESPYVFESLLDTLRDLARLMGADKSQHMQGFIAHLEAELAKRQEVGSG
jgi:tetratricopeptide (TPR) repeat protein